MNKNDYKNAAKIAFAGIASLIESALSGIAQVYAKADREAAVFEVQAGMALDSAKIEFAAAKAAGVSLAKTAGIGTDDWREYGRTMIPGKPNGTLYRWQNAGAVAKVLGDDLVPGTLVTSLSYLYRGLSSLSSKTTDEDRAAAEDLVREVYREAVEEAGTDDDGNALPPDREDLLARCEAAFPTNRSGGGGSGTTTTDDDDDEADDDEADEADESEADESRRADTVATASAAAVELANGPTDSIFRGLVTEYNVPRTTVVGIALAVLRLAEEHGPTTIQAVILAAGTTDDDEADEAADESDS
jgi:hypothetical protein